LGKYRRFQVACENEKHHVRISRENLKCILMNFRAFHLSFKENLTVNHILLSNCLLELQLVHIIGDVFDHIFVFVFASNLKSSVEGG